MTGSANRHLYIVLDDESRQKAARHARLAVVKCDHVTLAHAAPTDSTIAQYLDGEWQAGAELTLQVVAEYASEDVQAWLVELSGSSRRKHDGGRLHVTVSRSHSARSRDANALLESGTPTPRAEVLRGTLQWVEATVSNSEARPPDLS
ncbi:MAG: hypothetical protein EOO73_02460 [Myxococcales bacterium]|nr:MAG: hypothetical protein EOO73_02460 [Myxococcales bacterium]